MAYEFMLEVLKTSWEILITPWLHAETLWMILPLVLILVLIHLYFGRYRTEELGWNSAFSNSISLLWICVIILHSLHGEYGFSGMLGGEGLANLVIVGVLVIWVALMLVFNFFHVLPKKAAFTVSSSDFVYVLAYIIIAVVVGNIAVTNASAILAGILLFVVMVAVLQLMKRLVPLSKSSKKTMKKREKKNKRKKAGKKAAKTRKINKIIEWFKLRLKS